MKVIYKYKFDKSGEGYISIPYPANILKVDNQRGELVMWVEVDVDPDESGVNKFYKVVPTGAPYPTGGRWVGSAQFMEGNLVLHVIEYDSED